jgi:asparagine synthase (glutamine-hydrolysing)
MCGFIIISGKNLNAVNKNYFFHSAHKNQHRGPDQQDHYFDDNILCGAQTLKITKKNQFSNQPYKSKNRRFIITFNGQIYNYIELIKDLKKDFDFIYNNELEVIEKLFIKFNRNLVNYLNGMFAISIWDTKKKILYLFTDHFGIKQIYYTVYKNNWYFSSEIKDMKFFIPYYHFQEDEKLVSKFLKNSTSYLGNHTFYKNIKKLTSAQVGILKNNNFKKFCYWNLKIESNEKPDYKKLNKLFSDNFNLYSKTSVKKSFAISSGIDSNFILQQSIKDKNYNFKKDLSIISDLKKFHFYSEYQNNKNFFKNYQIKIDLFNDKKILDLSDIENLEYITEQPVHSSNVYVSLLLRKYLKSKNYNILFAGHGADEIFGGYDRAFYDYLYQLFNLTNKEYFIDFIKKSSNYLRINENQILKNFKNFRNNLGFNSLYFKKIEPFFKKEYLKKFSNSENKNLSSLHKKNFLKFNLKKQIFENDLPYLLSIEDKISMNNSIETRVPFLNKLLVEDIFNIDSKYFLENGKNKNILRNISFNLNHFQNWKQKKKQLPGDNYLFLSKYINRTILEKIQDDKSLDAIVDKKKILAKMKNLKKNELTNNYFIFRLLSYQRWKNQNI